MKPFVACVVCASLISLAAGFGLGFVAGKSASGPSTAGAADNADGVYMIVLADSEGEYRLARGNPVQQGDTVSFTDAATGEFVTLRSREISIKKSDSDTLRKYRLARTGK